jgi:hypothetical protein
MSMYVSIEPEQSSHILVSPHSPQTVNLIIESADHRINGLKILLFLEIVANNIE